MLELAIPRVSAFVPKIIFAYTPTFPRCPIGK